MGGTCCFVEWFWEVRVLRLIKLFVFIRYSFGVFWVSVRRVYVVRILVFAFVRFFCRSWNS